jgi:uncharacterized protein (TIGR02646 family)
MKRLVRAEAPACLNSLKHGCDEWEDVAKSDVWLELDKMQNGFCAYCECRLNRKHIDHLRTRNDYPKFTFNWGNLFGSCGDSSQKGGWGRCGIFKDDGAGKYNVAEIIKPDEEDPNCILLYLTSGIVVPNATNIKKGTETIRVFNLNGDTSLFNSRKQSINAIKFEVDELYGLQDELEVDDWIELLQDGLDSCINQEFQTALEHTWRYNQGH